MFFRPLGLLIAALAVGASAASLKLQSPRLVVSDTIGTQLRAEPFSLTSKLHETVEVGAKDILKLTFQIVGEEDGKGVQPHQTFIRFVDETTGEEGIQPVRVGPSGKAKFELVCLLLLPYYF